MESYIVSADMEYTIRYTATDKNLMTNTFLWLTVW
jgi:hypothetical protein